jgi:TRAP-type uncharacterized transport system substrate-binding protein
MLVSIFIAFMLLTSVADAKGGGFGGRSSSSSSSRSSISVRSVSKAAAVGGGAAYFSSNTSTTSKPAPIKVTRDNVMSSLSGGKGAKGDAAGALYKDFQVRNSPKPITRLSQADIQTRFTPQYRQNRRTDYYGSYTPTYSNYYHPRPSYGMWDAIMFASIMDNVGDRKMYYNHQSDPAFQSWRTDANAACAAGDKDVCEKLADLDKEMNEYKSKGVKQDPNYITPGIDPDIYESNNIDPSTLTTLKICTGALGSDYVSYANTIGKVTKMKVQSVPSNGSADNITKLASGACDLAFVQDDLVTTGLTKVVTLNQLEVGLLICRADAGIKTVKDLTDKNIVYVGSDQTGSQFTLDQLKSTVTNLSKVTIDNTHSILEAVNVAGNTPNSCVFGVSTPGFVGFTQLDQSNKFKGIPIFSFDFPNKKTSYTLVTVDVAHYKNLTQDQYKKYGWFTAGGTDTIGVSTSLVVPQNWIDQNQQMYNLLLLEKSNLASSLQ